MTNFDKKDFELLVRKCSLILGIVDTLNKEGSLTHKELAKKLNKSIQSLSNAMRKIEPFGVLFIRRIGKNVYYSLNFRGYLLRDFVSQEIQTTPINFSEETMYAPSGATVSGAKR